MSNRVVFVNLVTGERYSFAPDARVFAVVLPFNGQGDSAGYSVRDVTRVVPGTEPLQLRADHVRSVVRLCPEGHAVFLRVVTAGAAEPFYWAVGI